MAILFVMFFLMGGLPLVGGSMILGACAPTKTISRLRREMVAVLVQQHRADRRLARRLATRVEALGGKTSTANTVGRKYNRNSRRRHLVAGLSSQARTAGLLGRTNFSRRRCGGRRNPVVRATSPRTFGAEKLALKETIRARKRARKVALRQWRAGEGVEIRGRSRHALVNLLLEGMAERAALRQEVAFASSYADYLREGQVEAQKAKAQKWALAHLHEASQEASRLVDMALVASSADLTQASLLTRALVAQSARGLRQLAHIRQLAKGADQGSVVDRLVGLLEAA